MSRFFDLLIAEFEQVFFDVFYIRLALDSPNWIKICLDSSSRIFESCSLMSHWLFCWWLWASLFPVCQVFLRLYFVVLVCLGFSLGHYYSVSALNIVNSPILVFIPIVPWQFEQVVPNLSSFDQSMVSSSLRNLAKSNKLEKHSRSIIWRLISKLDRVLVVFFCANQNKQYIYAYIDVNIFPDT